MPLAPQTHPCPLCGSATEPFHADRRRAYARCPTCALISVPPAQHLDTVAE